MATEELISPEEAQSLAAIQEARRQIEIAREHEDVETLLTMRDQMIAVSHFLNKRHEAKELADQAGEAKVRAEAALGHLDRAKAPHGGSKKRSGEENGEEPDEENGDESSEAPLAAIRGNTRAQWRKLGQLDSEQLDQVISELRSEENESSGVTTARAVRLAREHLPAPAPREQGEIPRDQFKEMASEFVSHLKAVDTETTQVVRLSKKLVRRATDSERNRWASRLGNTIVRLEELRDTLAPESEEEDEE